MSRIDKLVSKAFPDELRHVEPIETDEDALFAMTLEKLGLDSPAPAGQEEPKGPLSVLRREKRQEKLVEVPLVRVKRRWANWIGGALAACLVLGCGIYWGSWLLHSLGFGTRAHSPGGGEEHPGVVAVGSPSPSPTPQRAGVQDELPAIDVGSSIATANRFTVTMSFRGLLPSAYKAEARLGSQELYCMERSTGEKSENVQLLSMTFVSEEMFEEMEENQLVLRLELIPGLLGEEKDIDLQAYPKSRGFVVDTRSGYTRELSSEELEELWGEAG